MKFFQRRKKGKQQSAYVQQASPSPNTDRRDGPKGTQNFDVVSASNPHSPSRVTTQPNPGMGIPVQSASPTVSRRPVSEAPSPQRVEASSNNGMQRAPTATAPPSLQVAPHSSPQVPPQVPPPVSHPGMNGNAAADNAQAGIDLTRSLVKKFIADIWNRGELDLIPEVCSPSLRFNGNTGFDRVGHDGLARMVGTIREALDDYHCEIHSMVVEHNKAFCRLRFTGKHTGNLLGYQPTGKVVAWMGATEFTCQNGKILKVWELGDIKTLEEQLTAAADQAEGHL